MSARQDRSVKTAESTAPEEFGPYLVYERLGVGGMATVHRAKKRGIAGFERGVALKRMLPHLAEDAEFINSFVREAKLASLLVHPNIAQIYDFGRVGAVYYIAMEHVDGFDVRKMLRYSNRHKEPLPLNVVMSILCELCDALEYAHTFVDEHGTPQGIVHRDVSPSNLIVAQSGHLKVIDFGIAKANVRQLHTESGRVKGKLGYMSPEAVTGRAFGPVSDVFSAGVVAHELLTAHPLFSAKTDYDTLIRIHEAEIPPPSRRNPGVPSALDEVVLAALSRDPERRLQTAGAFREALEYVAEQSGVRFSARDVAEWRAKIATTEDPWGSRTSLPNVSSSAVSRAFPYPDSRSSLSGAHQRPRSDSHTPSSRLSQEPRLSASGLPALNDPAGDTGDEDKSVADLTWGMDHGLAPTLHPVPDQAHTPLPPLAAPVASSSTSQPRRNSMARLALVVLFTIAAGLAVYQFLLRPKKQVVVAPPPPPALATVKFNVQPSDSIVEIAGKEVGRSSPFETKLEAGVYSVSVRHQGYKPWSTEVTLRSAEPQTVHVALEQGLARINVTSQPTGLAVQLDGKPLTQVTPLELQIPAGNHQLVVTNAAGLEWSEDFTAEVDRQYPFHATFSKDTKKVPAVATSNPARNNPQPPSAAGAAHPAPAPVDRDRDRKRVTTSTSRPGSAPSDDDVRITETPAEPTPPVPVKQPLKPDAGVPAVATQTTAPPPQTSATKTVPVVAANAVAKISGAIPTMKVEGVTDNYADVQGKVCIDDRGHVTSVKIIKALPEIIAELERTLTGWRYQPYTNTAGQLSPACFPVSFRVVFKRAG
jgi:serine/threonine-protein kinase